MVLRRGCRECFVGVLCVTSESFDRVRPRVVSAKNKASRAARLFCIAVLSMVFAGPSRRLRTLPHQNLFYHAS